MCFVSRRQRATTRFPFNMISATSARQASASANERYSGKAIERRYEGMTAVASSEGVKPGVENAVEEIGGSSAEKAGVRVLIVHALSGVGSCCVVRVS
jgi:hypothetical protein